MYISKRYCKTYGLNNNIIARRLISTTGIFVVTKLRISSKRSTHFFSSTYTFTPLYHHVSKTRIAQSTLPSPCPLHPFIQIGPHKSVSLAPLPRKETSFGQMAFAHPPHTSVEERRINLSFDPYDPLPLAYLSKGAKYLVPIVSAGSCLPCPSYKRPALTTLVYVYGFGLDDRVCTCNIAHVHNVYVEKPVCITVVVMVVVGCAHVRPQNTWKNRAHAYGVLYGWIGDDTFHRGCIDSNLC